LQNPKQSIKMPSQWDHRSDKDLLLTIIEMGSLSHIDWETVSATMKAKEYTFTKEACRQHYQKIRKEARNSAPNGSFSTPVKATAKAATKSTPATGSKGKSASFAKSAYANNYEDDDEEYFMTPSIKRQRSGVKKEKTEPVDMGGFYGQTAAQFKVEYENDGSGFDSPIDLVDDGIYEA